jgi:hypothetical protein
VDARETGSSETGTGSGPFVRATSRGALVLETEHARRMMHRLRDLEDRVDPDPRAAAKPASEGR